MKHGFEILSMGLGSWIGTDRRWCWEWDRTKWWRSEWGVRGQKWKKKEAWRWNGRGNRREWRSVISSWDWSWPKAPFSPLFWARKRIWAHIFEGPIRVGPPAPPFSPPETNTPLREAETATPLAAVVKQKKGLTRWKSSSGKFDIFSGEKK